MVCFSFLFRSRGFSQGKGFLTRFQTKYCSSYAEAGEGSKVSVELQSKFLRTLHDRGFIHQCTDFAGIDPILSSNNITSGYIGFDATAASLHVGSLIQIMMLRWYQKCGHKPIVLVGGGTTRIGDPSGKDESRQLLSDDDIKTNADSLSKVFSRFIQFGSGPTDAIMVNNADWLVSINYLDFLRDYGRHFTINRMLNFDSVQTRLKREQPLTFLEFNYMLLQAYDFYQLFKRYNVQLQLGGSDQWGNIVNGVELVRKLERKSVFGITAPLITTSDGKKMGKSASGAVWLNRDYLSEYDYWQFWRNTDDKDVIRFLKLFTELPLEQINDMTKWEGAALNEAKVILADEATSLLHGSECLESIHATVASLFASRDSNSLDSLPRIALNDVQVAAVKGSTGLPVVDILVVSGLVKSKSEARTFINGGGIRINGVKISDEKLMIGVSDFVTDGCLKIAVGKKKHVLITCN